MLPKGTLIVYAIVTVNEPDPVVPFDCSRCRPLPDAVGAESVNPMVVDDTPRYCAKAESSAATSWAEGTDDAITSEKDPVTKMGGGGGEGG